MSYSFSMPISKSKLNKNLEVEFDIDMISLGLYFTGSYFVSALHLKAQKTNIGFYLLSDKQA